MPMMPPEPVYFLLVDDLEENLLSLEALLRRDNLIILKARSGHEALELLLTHEVALAFLDVQMPGMDGFELAELMRGTERTRRVPIIFLTAGTADTQRRFRGYGAGAVDFLNKPIEPDVIRSKADVFFELYRRQQQVERHSEKLKITAEENARLLKESQAYAKALQEADTRKDEFLATLAHELRNPLAPIRNGLTILRMSPDSDKAPEIRDMMDRQLTHLVRLIDDLLDISRVSQGKIELRNEKITVQSVIQAAVEASQPLIDAGEHQITVNLPDDKLWIDADSTRISQIISNLLNNAAKYTPKGGHIILSVRAENNQVVITVNDNGNGIEPNMLPHIFDLFTQVENSIKLSQGGMGIGLALVRRLITLHNGTIHADSDGAGKGSTFTVRLPLTEAAKVKTMTSQDAKLPQSSLRVLVVDDNVPSAQTIGWMLELSGHEPILVHSGEAALEAAKTQQPQAVLLDIGLPGMDGYDICRELRAMPEFEKIMIIAQTGWGQARDRNKAAEAGFDHHLTKPVNMDELAELLAKAG